jgi:hypothetical protein
VNDELLADVIDMAKIHLELWKKKHGAAAAQKGHGAEPGEKQERTIDGRPF